uniref:HhH-GPD domain-containing protein n=2 Tax=Pycnococcus provasolii TaxID=41880 RepID=A0A7R9SXW4_9CHLO|mmetsp:Transcript_3549/g.8014  ORF Transcript_3549/g.8014 Transcript_3549/m.8014 type:complete len:284 (+) Transcript_3549:67-918(+)
MSAGATSADDGQQAKKRQKRAPLWTPFVGGDAEKNDYNVETDAIVAFRHLASADGALKAQIDLICANKALDSPEAAVMATNFVRKVVVASPFITLVRSIVCSRVNKTVAANTLTNLANACGYDGTGDLQTSISPQAIAAIDEDKLATEIIKGFACFQKAKFLRSLAQTAIDNPTLVSLERLNVLEDRLVLEDHALNQVNGVGPGTLLNMLMCSGCARPDVLPYTDSLLRKFVLGDDFAKQYDIKKAEGERAVCAKLDEETAAWKPWRSIGAMLAFDEKNALHD